MKTEGLTMNQLAELNANYVTTISKLEQNLPTWQYSSLTPRASAGAGGGSASGTMGLRSGVHERL